MQMRFPKEGTRAWKVLYVIAIIIRPFFVRLNIEGEENIPAAGGCVIACNHTLGADYVLLGYASPRQVYYMAKSEIFAFHPLLAKLGPEPLAPEFTADYLFRKTRGRRVAVKLLIMNSQIVVGVGNIYASEALFRAGIRPGRAAKSLTREECAGLVKAIRAVLAMAIRHGGTTLRDYVGAGGEPGYFRQKLYVYERAGEPCRKCGALVKHRVQGQRSTYWCGDCQH